MGEVRPIQGGVRPNGYLPPKPTTHFWGSPNCWADPQKLSGEAAMRGRGIGSRVPRRTTSLGAASGLGPNPGDLQPRDVLLDDVRRGLGSATSRWPSLGTDGEGVKLFSPFFLNCFNFKTQKKKHQKSFWKNFWTTQAEN